MEWWQAFALIVSALFGLMIIGTPIAFAFLAVNIVGAYIFWGGTVGLGQMVLSIMDSVASFSILPVPLFILLGEILFRSGLASRLMDVLDVWMGRVPGRLSLMAVGGGTLFGTLTGSGAAATAMLGRILVPEMANRGYKRPMTLGPVMGAGGLAIMIPPSALGVLLAAIANISVGDFLMAILVPGLVMAALYVAYILIRCRLQPDLAPIYEAPAVPLGQKLRQTVIYVFPLVTIVFLVTGVIFLGIATPTEAAALGVVGAILLAAAYRSLNLRMLWLALQSTLLTSLMVLMIVSGATAFSQLLAFTGASSGLVQLATSLDVDPIVIVILMQLVLLVLGTFMEALAMIMLTVPIFFPIIESLGLSPFWFGAIMLLNMEMAAMSPPFGFTLFVMKGVAPRGTTMGEIYLAALPFLALDAIVMLLIILFPPIALTLVNLAG